MINLKDINQSDVGRLVKFENHLFKDEGSVTKFNEYYIFVNFNNCRAEIPVNPANLTFINK